MDGLSPDYCLWFEFRADMIDKEFISHIEKFKSVWIFIGVESGTQSNLTRLAKGLTLEKTLSEFDLIKNIRIFTQ